MILSSQLWVLSASFVSFTIRISVQHPLAWSLAHLVGAKSNAGSHLGVGYLSTMQEWSWCDCCSSSSFETAPPDNCTKTKFWRQMGTCFRVQKGVCKKGKQPEEFWREFCGIKENQTVEVADLVRLGCFVFHHVHCLSLQFHKTISLTWGEEMASLYPSRLHQLKQDLQTACGGVPCLCLANNVHICPHQWV